MHVDTAIEKDPPRSGRRKHAGTPRSRDAAGTGTEAHGGPVFVDSSGRRARLFRRAGIALGVACVGYVAVLGLAFMGGISMSPSELIPFGGAPSAQGGPGGNTPPGGAGAPPSGPPAGGRPTASPSVSASVTVPASAASVSVTTGTG
ncbi:hypothetical protein [Streptomyces sp. NBC_00841]|uniref:hypothetical protein n=1 Tax=unclassified Streptomyces TaxID=2593676 RepID=UPI002DDA8667|nr:hypothetical protein [Streptomyces sp. NBC_00841]WSA02946.1 hypothetical protein OHA79_36955 [Streptomyces sp. NBC_00841]